MSSEHFVTVDAQLLSDNFEALQATTNLLFKSASDFSQYIEMIALKEDKSVVDVILEYCDDHDIDPDAISKLVNDALKGKIEAEMIQSGLLDERNTLDRFN